MTSTTTTTDLAAAATLRPHLCNHARVAALACRAAAAFVRLDGPPTMEIVVHRDEPDAGLRLTDTARQHLRDRSAVTDMRLDDAAGAPIPGLVEGDAALRHGLAAPIPGGQGWIGVLDAHPLDTEPAIAQLLEQLGEELAAIVAGAGPAAGRSDADDEALLVATDAVAVILDEQGTITATNVQWRHTAEVAGATPLATGSGANYLAECDRAAADGVQDAATAAVGIRAVLSGTLGDFLGEYAVQVGTLQHWCRYHVLPLPTMRGQRFVVMHHDVTTERLALQAAEGAQRRYRELFESAPDAIVVLDAEARVVQVNRAFESRFGWSRDQIRGAEVDVLLPDDGQRQALRELIPPAATSATPGLHTIALDLRTQGGDDVAAELRLSPLDSTGVPRTMLAIRDVSERRAVEQRLAQSEARRDRLRTQWELTAEAVGLGRWELDVTSGTTSWDHGMRALHELPPDGAGEVGWHALLAPADHARVQAAAEAALSGHGALDHTYQLHLRSGAVRHIRIVGRARRDGSGIDHRLRGIAIDSTAQHEARAALEEQTERLQLALSGGELGMWDWNPLTNVTQVDDGWASMLGLVRADLEPVVSEWERRVHPDDLPRVYAVVADYFAGNTPMFECPHRLRHADGTWRWILTRGKVVARDDLGRPARMVGIHQDISRQVALEERAERDRSRLGAILDGLFGFVAVLTPDGHVLQANRTMREATGISTEALASGAIWASPLFAHDPRASAELRTAVRQASLGEQVRLASTIASAHRPPIHVDMVVSPLHDADAADGQVILFAVDVSDRAALQAQLLQAQKMEAIGRLAGGVAHDFNNILTVIGGHCELLLADLRANDPLRGDVEEVRRAAERAVGLTRQLLSFSRREVQQPRPIALGDVVRRLVPMLRRLIGEDLLLTIDIEAVPSTILIDPTQLEQVVLNLVVNARDAMPGGGEITVAVHAVHPTAGEAPAREGAPRGALVELAIRDTGIGMDAATQAHIFEPFFTTKAADRGTGLGLATVYGIVTSCGGQIVVESAPNAGTTFRLRFPLADDRADADAAAAPVAADAVHGTVLLVEDDASVRRLTAEALRREGFVVLEARDGADGLARAEQFDGTIHVLVTDVVMPQLGGRALAQRMATLRPGTRILLVSGYTDDPELRRDLQGGGVAFLQKPFTLSSLVGEVRRLLLAP